MLLGTKETLEDFLVHLLTEHHSVSIGFLHAEVARRFRSYSVPAVYKELRKLETQGIVHRREKKVSLSLSWIMNMSSLTDRMYDLHTRGERLTHVLPEYDEKLKLRFSNLERLDDFWIHTIILILQKSSRPKLYQWMPHPWFNLIHSQKSLPFHRALKVGGYSVENIIGGQTWLDRRAAKLSVQGVYEYSFAPGPFESERSTYYSITDTYLLTIKLLERKANELEQLYATVETATDLETPGLLKSINDARGSVLTIEKGGRRHKKIWNKFIEYFAVPAGVSAVRSPRR